MRVIDDNVANTLEDKPNILPAVSRPVIFTGSTLNIREDGSVIKPNAPVESKVGCMAIGCQDAARIPVLSDKIKTLAPTGDTLNDRQFVVWHQDERPLVGKDGVGVAATEGVPDGAEMTTKTISAPAAVKPGVLGDQPSGNTATNPVNVENALIGAGVLVALACAGLWGLSKLRK